MKVKNKGDSRELPASRDGIAELPKEIRYTSLYGTGDGYNYTDKYSQRGTPQGEIPDEMLHDEIMDEMRFYNSMTNNFVTAMKEVWAWRKMTYSELAAIIMVDARTISRIVNGKRPPALETLVLICLGMNLPSLISRYLIDLSPCSLNLANPDHFWYMFALVHMYRQPLETIREFLKSHQVFL